MGTKRALQEVDPLSLPVGFQVGPWRVKGWRGRGMYGTLYCVEREGHAEEGEFALKVAIHSGDERFGREAELLRRITSPHVPRFRAQGVWEHPAGAFPYVVMELVEGEALYEWAARRNPSSRQVLRLLAQVARALEATHAAGGVHRDVKGYNVLVRPGDGRVFLTDFGAGHYRGAATLTSKLLAPGAPAYRSPEAWAFVSAFLRHPTARYPASACDDLFALGVMAYRLVTDEYPPPTHPGELGSEVWRQDGPGARPVRELNPRVSPALEAVIQQLLAIAPVERFGGRARKAVEALEEAAEKEGPEGDELLFGWGEEHRPRLRSPEARNRARANGEQTPPRTFTPMWRTAVGLVGLLISGLLVAGPHQGQQVAQGGVERDSPEGDSVAVGDSAEPASALDPKLADNAREKVGLPMPEDPLPNQRKPPCTRRGEVEIHGGCWFALRDATPPCGDEAYAWKGACYLPSEPPQRQPAARPP
jgi:hypothetical protein